MFCALRATDPIWVSHLACETLPRVFGWCCRSPGLDGWVRTSPASEVERLRMNTKPQTNETAQFPDDSPAGRERLWPDRSEIQ